MNDLLLVRYGELGLKGKNRFVFENQLLKNIKLALEGAGKARVFTTHSRIFVEVISGNKNVFIERLQKVFGIASLSPVLKTEPELTMIKEKALALMRQVHVPGESFKVDTRRADKSFPLTSPEISREVAGYILSQITELPVDVHAPKHLLQVEIREKEAYIFTEAYQGAGGLPVGTSGKGLLLISGGIDSPVAAYMALKRGVKIEALHFHSFPFTGERSREKVVDLCRALVPYGGSLTLHVASFTEIQKAIRQYCPPQWGITIMRRMMLRLAEKVAGERGAKALFTGENLGQVASQTMESLATIEKAVGIPVLRPLIGFDKKEIIDLAKKINTFEISIRPFEDCCTIFVPKHPVTRPEPAEATKIETAFDFAPLLAACLEKIETQVLSAP